MRTSLVLLLVSIGCGAKPDLLGDGGGGDGAQPSRASLSITPKMSTIATGTSSQFMITNEGDDTSDAIALEIMGNGSGSFLIANPTCTSLAPHGVCTVDVIGVGKTANAMADLKATAGDKEADATLLGTATIGMGSLKIAPTMPNAQFMPTPLGATSSPVSYTLTNTAMASSGPLSLGLDANSVFKFGGQTNHCAGADVPAGGTCLFGLEFAPSGMGSSTRGGMVFAQGGPGISGSATLSGAVLPLVTVSPSAKSFGMAFACPTAPLQQQTFTISNPTAAAWTSFSATVTGPDVDAFQSGQSNCSALGAAAGGTCMVTIGVSQTVPSTPGPKSATLQVAVMQNGIPATVAVPLSVTAVACDQTTIVLNPPSLVFHGVAIGGSATMPIMVKSAVPTGPLTIVATPPFTQTNDCTAPLTATSTCTIMVTFAPTNSVSATGSVTVTAVPGGTATALLSTN